MPKSILAILLLVLIATSAAQADRVIVGQEADVITLDPADSTRYERAFERMNSRYAFCKEHRVKHTSSHSCDVDFYHDHDSEDHAVLWVLRTYDSKGHAIELVLHPGKRAVMGAVLIMRDAADRSYIAQGFTTMEASLLEKAAPDLLSKFEELSKLTD